MGGWWWWALVSPNGVVLSRIVSVSASVNLPLHHKVPSSLLAQAHPGDPGKRAIKWLRWCGIYNVPAQEMAKHRAKFGWLPLSDTAAVTKARHETH